MFFFFQKIRGYSCSLVVRCFCFFFKKICVYPCASVVRCFCFFKKSVFAFFRVFRSLLFLLLLLLYRSEGFFYRSQVLAHGFQAGFFSLDYIGWGVG